MTRGEITAALREARDDAESFVALRHQLNEISRLRYIGEPENAPIARTTLPTPITAPPMSAPPCIHRGEKIGKVKVECRGCGGNRYVDYTVRECAMYNRCLPSYNPADREAWEGRKPESDIYQLCHGCPDASGREADVTTPPA